MRIVVLDGYTENPGDLSWGQIGELGDLTVYDRTQSNGGPEALTSLIVSRSLGAEAVIVNKTPLDARTLEALVPALRYVGVLATGFNVIDVGRARELGVSVSNIPDYGTQAVAQHAMALLLELSNHVGEHSASAKSGEWETCPDFCYWKQPIVELAGKTFGSLGYGRIGRATSALAAAFGMCVIACDQYAGAPGSDSGSIAEMVGFEDLISRSDVLSLHCPLTPETSEVIDSRALTLMKRGSFLINTSRGGLINERDVARALADGRLAGAAVDVMQEEPPESGAPLLSAPNCIVTPHIAWASKESRIRLMGVAAENLRRFFAGSPQNIVN